MKIWTCNQNCHFKTYFGFWKSCAFAFQPVFFAHLGTSFAIFSSSCPLFSFSFLSPQGLFGLGMDGSPLAKGIKPNEEEAFFDFSEPEEVQSTLSITVVGASGDLAKMKIFPALFAI